MIHVTVPTLDRLATLGDQARESTAALFDFHREYVEVLTSLFRRDPVAGFGQWYLSHSSVKQMHQPYTLVYDLLFLHSDIPERPLQGLYPVYYAPGAGHLFARSSWRPEATWLSVLAGALTESHAHHDLGSSPDLQEGVARLRCRVRFAQRPPSGRGAAQPGRADAWW